MFFSVKWTKNKIIIYFFLSAEQYKNIYILEK